MLATILTFAPPILLIVGMFGVGLSMTRQSAAEVVRRSDRLAMVTVLQVVLLPLLGVITALVMNSPGHVAAAILLISVCPGGGISNLYVLYAGANTSLSVLMTLTSLAIANITIPVVIATLTWLGLETPVSAAPTFDLTLRLISVIVIPIVIGMLVRAAAPGFALVWQKRLRSIAMLMVVATLVLILWLDREAVASDLNAILPAVALFLALSLVLGYLVGRCAYTDTSDQFAVMTEFAVRNVAVGIFLAVGLGHDLSFAGTASVYLVIEAITILLLGWVYRVRVHS